MVGNRCATGAEMARHLRENVVVTEDGCWIWAGCMNSTGTPRVVWQRKARNARRLAVELRRGVALTSADRVWTTCGDLRCMAPGHTRVTTKAEFYAQTNPTLRGYVGVVRSLAIARGRERNARLPFSRRDEVERRLAAGETPAQVAAFFGVTRQGLWQARKRWAVMAGRIDWRVAA